MGKSHLKLVAPIAKSEQLDPGARPMPDLRTREYLTEAEVERSMEGTKGNRYGHRDATMILVAYRHGLRVSELVLGSSGLQDGYAARPQGQTGHPKHVVYLRNSLH